MKLPVEPDNEEHQRPQPLRILCVDDEENILKALRRFFRDERLPMLMATTGAQGLAMLHSNDNIGLILSDQRMPDMNGTDFLIAAKAYAPGIPRIILTGYADKNIAQEAVRRGLAFRVLQKPWNEAELLQAVRDGLSGNILNEDTAEQST